VDVAVQEPLALVDWASVPELFLFLAVARYGKWHSSGKAMFEEFEDGGAHLFPVEMRNGDAKNDLEDSIGELICGHCHLRPVVGSDGLRDSFRLSARSQSVGRLVT